MAKDILLYDYIYNDTAAAFINELTASKGDVRIKVNSGGGNVYAGWGMIGAIQEERQKGRKINLQIDGIAASMAANLPAFADKTTAWNISKFMIHRAESSIYQQSDQERLDNINKDLRSALEKKINTSQLMRLKNVTMDQIFDPANRIDVNLTADEALQIGLIDEVKDITESEVTAIMHDVTAIMQCTGKFMMNEFGIPQQQQTKPVPQPEKIMTLQELKEKFPAVYAAAVADGKLQEQDRVGAWMSFVDVDAKAVSEGIKSGNNITQTAMADFTRKQISAEALKLAEDKGAQTTNTPSAQATAEAEQKERDDAFAEARKLAVSNL